MILLQHFTKYFNFCLPLWEPTVSLKDYGSWQLSYCGPQMVACLSMRRQVGADRLCQTLVPGLLQPTLGFAAGWAAEPQLTCTMVEEGCHSVMADSAEHYNGSSGSFRKEQDRITDYFKGFLTYCFTVSWLSLAFLAGGCQTPPSMR